MCKIMIVVGVKNPKNLWKLTKEITPLLSKDNNDGLGFASIDAKGKIFAERWLKNNHAFMDYGLSRGDVHLFKTLGTDAFKEKFTDEYCTFGDKKEFKEDSTTSLILHARAATGLVELQNVHPFVTKGTALIHNGVIRNHEKLTKTLSTCDSEVILHEYINSGVAADVNKINAVVETIKGPYACGVLSKDADGMPIIDVFKSFSPTLYVTYVDEIGSTVFCTSRTDLRDALLKLNWNVNKILEFANDQYYRFNAITGEKLTNFKINSSEHWQQSYTTPYVNSDRDREEFDAIVDRFQKEVDWVKMIEEEEAKRLASKQAMI